MKNVICCCDGTWNTRDERHDGILVPTNVVRLFNALAETDTNEFPQKRYYHPGVGTGSSWYDKIIGGGTGKGLDKNIMSAYRYLCDHYECGDKIYLFGFSRGAYTVRSLAGFIHTCGLLMTADLSDKQVWDTINTAFNAGYRKHKNQSEWVKNCEFIGSIPIHFIGVWDTVGALGIPEDMGLLSLLDSPKQYQFHDTRLNDDITYARHAMAIDELRASFQPTLWNEDGVTEEKIDGRPRLKQIWFPGVHSDVGGGYPETGLSDGALQWMMEEAEQCGLCFKSAMKEQIRPNALGQLHDSCCGVFAGLPTRPRCIPKLDVASTERHFSASAVERYDTPPIFDAPYHIYRPLKSGERIALDIFAEQPWNATGIWLDESKFYHFEATGAWVDDSIVYDPQGQHDGQFHPKEMAHMIMSLIGKLESQVVDNPDFNLPGTKREEEYPWFSLVGTVACNLVDPHNEKALGHHEHFLIGKRLTHFRPQKSGYLYAYANDAWGFYKNNHGHVRLTIAIDD